MTVRLAVAAGMAVLVALAGCGTGVQAPPRGTPGVDVDALRVKVHALEADQCQRLDPRAVFPDCGRYVTEVAGTVGALRAQLGGKPNAADALARLQSGVATYQGRSCEVPGGPVEECATALATLRTALAQLGDTLPGG
jgi:hypothetical protein